MTGAEWIAEKINSSNNQEVKATVEGESIVFVERSNRPDAFVGIVSTRPKDSTPLVSLDEAKHVRAQSPDMAMMIAIPRGARWSGAAMSWLQSEGIAFGGVGDLLSATSYDDDMSTHRNKTLEFVDDGLRRHSRVADLAWIESKKVEVILRNNKKIMVALDDAYDITMAVARDAARTLGNFDVLLKTNPNGSITSDGEENVERLGFQTLKWGELFGYLAKRGGQAGNDDLRERLRRARKTT